jgi:hypothetical protein
VGRKGGDVDAWADRITASLNRTVEGIFETGRLLCDAKAALDHGKWMRLHEEGRIPLSERSAQHFMAIWTARDRLLPKAQHVALLPPSWGTLYDLQALPDDTLAWAIEQGQVRPDMQRKDVPKLRRAFADAQGDAALGTPAADVDEDAHPDWSGLSPDKLRMARLRADGATYGYLRKAWRNYPHEEWASFKAQVLEVVGGERGL